MKIHLVVCTELDFEFRVFRQVKSLVSASHEVTVIGHARRRDPAAWSPARVNFILSRGALLRGPLFFGYFFLSVFLVLLREKPLLVHAVDLPSLVGAGLYSLFRRVRIIYEERELLTESPGLGNKPLRRFIWRRLEKAFIRRAGRYIVVTQADGDFLQKRHNIKQPVVIKNVALKKELVRSTILRDRLAASPEEKIVLYIGALSDHRDLPTAIQAMERIPGSRLVLAGDGPWRGRLAALSRSLGLEKRIDFLGHVPFKELHEMACSADMGIVPSGAVGQGFINTSPNKFFEYVMAGLPMVAVRLPEIEKLNWTHRVALLYGSSDQEDFAEKVNELLRDRNLYRELREGCLRAREEWNWERESQVYLGLFRDPVPFKGA
jgi:glycosyltransferase involved in cell wall biosynthesis